MKLVLVLSVLVALAVAWDPPLADPCDEEYCQVPTCRCSSTNIPGGLRARDTPQFVTITFDGAVNMANIVTYREEFYGKTNRNGCPIGATFYVAHEYTNYQLVNELYNQGFEIGLNSISHRTPQSFWAEADFHTITYEIARQRSQIIHFANVPFEAIKGVRLPFLQLAGNVSFEVMADVGLEYDATWSTTAYTNPGLWPYTLHYASIQDCNVPPCPTAHVPRVWVAPLIAWFDLNGTPCATVDACFSVPDRNDVYGWFTFFITNFERHYLGNRAPFSVNLRESHFTNYPAAKTALRIFLELLKNLDDVFVVNTREVIEWVKNPIPLNQYKVQPCRTFASAICRFPSTCGPLESEHNGMFYWMAACNICPRVYPWVGNPLGR